MCKRCELNNKLVINPAGIDYGRIGGRNRDKKFHYGIMIHHHIGQGWYESSEPLYEYYCPECGEYLKRGAEAKQCPRCRYKIKDGDWDMDDPVAFIVNEKGFKAYQNQDSPDVWVIKSPYFTYCSFCSPCAPGAGDLDSPNEQGIMAYCFGHDWFENGVAPYPVYDCKTGKEVTVNIRPTANEVEVGGEAVAINCTGEEE